MPGNISESLRARHQVIDESLEITRKMLQDPALSGGLLGQWAAEQLFIIDNYFFVPNLQGNQLVADSKHKDDQLVPVFAAEHGEELVLDKSLTRMHAWQKTNLAEYATSIGASLTPEDIDSIDHNLQEKFSGELKPISLDKYTSSSLSTPVLKTEINRPGKKPDVIPIDMRATPIMLFSMANNEPVVRGGRAIHNLVHLIQILTEDPIDPSKYKGVKRREESEARSVTRLLRKALRKKSSNPDFKDSPLLK